MQALNINYEILDQWAGFGIGYTSKLFALSEYSSNGGRRSKRHFVPESFDAYMEALGLELVAVENPDKVAKLGKRSAKASISPVRDRCEASPPTV